MSLLDGKLIEVEVYVKDISRRLYQCEFNGYYNLIESGCEWLVLHIISRLQEPITVTVPVKINGSNPVGKGGL